MRKERSMTARQWMNRAWNVAREIESLERSRNDEFDKMTKMTPAYSVDPVQSASDPHKFERLSAYSEAIDRQKERLDYIKAETLAAISLLPNSIHRQILKERYLDMLRFEAISLNIRYSYKQTRRLHARALEELERMEGPWN